MIIICKFYSINYDAHKKYCLTRRLDDVGSIWSLKKINRMKTLKEIAPEVKQAMAHLQRKELPAILSIQGEIIRSMHSFMDEKGVLCVNPIMTSPITDPLNHDVTEADFTYADQQFSLMKSMILHKQLLLAHEDIEAIYIVSPNVRLEGPERKETGRHLFEFTQVDFEFKDKDMDYVLDFTEELVTYVFKQLNKRKEKELMLLRGGPLKIPGKWKRYLTQELIEKYGEDYEVKASLATDEPFWVIDHEREFYDKEDESNRGHYLNYDILWPEGFIEGLSGAERENEYEQILKRMKETKTDPDKFKAYLDAAKAGILPKTAGAGIGIERMTRFVTKRKDVNEVCPFSRKPYDTTVY